MVVVLLVALQKHKKKIPSEKKDTQMEPCVCVGLA